MIKFVDYYFREPPCCLHCWTRCQSWIKPPIQVFIWIFCLQVKSIPCKSCSLRRRKWKLYIINFKVLFVTWYNLITILCWPFQNCRHLQYWRPKRPKYPRWNVVITCGSTGSCLSPTPFQLWFDTTPFKI